VTAPLLVALLMQAPAAAPPVDPRGVEVLRERCSGGLAVRDITLFLNGTVRLREGAPGEDRLELRELGPEEVERLIRDLGDIDLGETGSNLDAPQGAWTESCRLDLALPGRPPLRIDYGRLDTGSLGLDRLRRIVETLVEAARLGAGSTGFPAGYKPAVGDVVERDDGLVFTVVGFTSDEKGVELAGTEEPLTVYVAREDVAHTFRRLVRRGPPAP
jgi:hypothetical protein